MLADLGVSDTIQKSCGKRWDMGTGCSLLPALVHEKSSQENGGSGRQVRKGASR